MTPIPSPPKTQKKRDALRVSGGAWLDIRKHKPEPGSRVLVCDENGYVDIEDVDGENRVRDMTWIQLWKAGNGTNLVAWMPIPDFPKELCREDADGEIP